MNNLKVTFNSMPLLILNSFFEKNIVAVLFFSTGLYTFLYSKYKTATLSKFTEAWQYSTRVYISVR